MKFYVLIPLLTVLLPSLLQADTWKDGPYAGYVFGGDTGSAGAAFGWQVAHEFNDLISIEGTVGVHQDEWDADPAVQNASGPLDLSVVTGGLTARAGWYLNPFTLYLAGGAAYYAFDGDPKADSFTPATGASRREVSTDIENEFGWQLGAGAEWLLNKQWEIFLEYRLNLVDAEVEYRIKDQYLGSTPGTANDFRVDTQVRRESRDYNHHLLRVGVNYRF